MPYLRRSYLGLVVVAIGALALVTQFSAFADDGSTFNDDPLLHCSPEEKTIKVNESITFQATGGNGTYNWSGTPIDPGNIASFTFKFVAPGYYPVYVWSGSQGRLCAIDVTSEPAPTPPIEPVSYVDCSPLGQYAQIGVPVTFRGFTYDADSKKKSVIGNWSAPEGTPSTNVDSKFKVAFNTPGDKTITFRVQGVSATCEARVLPPPVGAESETIYQPEATVTPKPTPKPVKAVRLTAKAKIGVKSVVLMISGKKYPFYDDGKHNDGKKGDRLYGSNVFKFTKNTSYVIVITYKTGKPGVTVGKVIVSKR